MTDRTEVLTLKSINKTFINERDSFSAVKNVSLNVMEREAVGIVGESGCGKSTLARLITRLERLDSGQIILNGNDITTIKGKKLRQSYSDVKMIFQNPISSFDPRISIGRSIDIALKTTYTKMKSQDANQEVLHLLDMVGLDGSYKDSKPHEISGGECQRAAIARAIATKPKLLICDEITSALDVLAQAQIMDLLTRFRKKMSMSFLFISHDLALVNSFCSRIYVMRKGEIIESGESQNIMLNPQNEYTRFLISSILTV